MDKSKLASVNVDVMSIENFATKEAEQIVEIDMTTPEYTADTCLMPKESVPTMPSDAMNMILVNK